MLQAIHPFGPPVGAYVPAANTDIRHTLDRERARLAGVAAPAGIEVRDLADTSINGNAPGSLPRTNAFLGLGSGCAVFA